MKICQINPGLITIPPNGWGAIEKIIWEYAQHLKALPSAPEVDIKYPNEVISPTQYDVVHVHVANQALMLAERKIPYIFTMHDHHAYVWGKSSPCFQQNREAIEKSVFSIVPAEYLIDYFEHHYKTFYLPHGVNTKYFKRLEPASVNDINLLCVANNGFIHNQAEDRKGFRFAIEAAQQLGYPIIIAGPKNNEKFFDANKDLLNYSELDIRYDLNEDQLRAVYEASTIFIHASSAEAGHPNLTLLEALSMGLPIAGTYDGSIELKGLIKVERNTESVRTAIEDIVGKYYQYSAAARNTAEKFDYSVIVNRLERMYRGFGRISDSPNSIDMKANLINFYEDTKPMNFEVREFSAPTVNVNFVNGAFCEILGYGTKKYKIQFIDPAKKTIIHESTLPLNNWSRTNKQSFVPWIIRIRDENDSVIFEHKYDASNKRVYIHLDSKSLGDTLAWFPFVEEFRKKHNCTMICSTFWNHFFEKTYPNIEFVTPGSTVQNLYAMYTIGWFYNKDGSIDYNKNVYDFKSDTLQKTASDILGLEYSEIRPHIYIDPKKLKPTDKKFVCMAMHSTAQAKYWNNPTGWQEVVNHIKSKGYEVYHISKEKGTYMGNTPPTGVVNKTGDIDIYDRINDLLNCKFFIGIGSGLSWLAWAVGCKIVLISGFSDEYTEFAATKRIINKSVCNSCFNKHRLDPGDWNWCPVYKNTPRQFECTKQIFSSDVIQAINEILQ